MKVLITGGAGFIGSHMVDLALNAGAEVHVVDNFSTGSMRNIAHHRSNSNFHCTHADLLTWDGIKEAVGSADRIYHLAAVVGVKRVLAKPVQVMSANVAGTERLLRAVHQAGHNPRVIIASSSEVYGFNPAAEFDEESDLLLRARDRLRWTYAVTKLADEYLAFAYASTYGHNISIVRLFNTIGPRQTGRYGMVVPTLVEQAVRGEPLTVYGDGRQTRSFCDVRDTVTALHLLANCDRAAGEVVNLGNDQEIAIVDLAELIRERARSDSAIKLVPYSEAYGRHYEDVTHRRPVLTKLHELTGFEPHWQLQDTLDEMIETQQKPSGSGGAVHSSVAH